MPNCPLCTATGGFLLLQTPAWRIIRVEDTHFPVFYRVIWNAHVSEWSELSADERIACMEVVVGVEEILCAHLQPTKINLASLGNVVPHLHWHIIARFDWDTHYPDPIWGTARREANAQKMQALQAQIPAIDAAIRQRFAHQAVPTA